MKIKTVIYFLTRQHVITQIRKTPKIILPRGKLHEGSCSIDLRAFRSPVPYYVYKIPAFYKITSNIFD